VDGSGQVYYTDKPRHEGYKRIVKSIPTYSISDAGTRALRPVSQSRPRYSERNRYLYSELITSAAERYQLDPALLHAVVQAESGYNPGAHSNKGAVGLMQLMPATAERFGVRDPWDPADNVEGGARYLSTLISMFQEDIPLAVAAYNAGENAVIKYGYRVPPYPETQDYVAKVMNYYRRMN
jgi:soluble lytic murein transglycosylase-like protein